MAARSSSIQIALASVSCLGACTTDFTGYHLASNADAGSGATSDSGGRVSTTGGGDGSSHGAEGGETDAVIGAGGAGESGSAALGAGTGGSANIGAGGSSAAGSASVGPPSCESLASNCGSEQSASCCSTSLVPGGTYARSAEAGDNTSVSDFVLDDYEVTVGRFRNFVSVFAQGMTAAGSGKNPHNAADVGWETAWNPRLPVSPAALATELKCSGGTFSTNPGANENEPITCVNWYEAYAFCIWDGGRLPTEAEWNYAAAGGTEERAYPWGSAVPDDSLAVFCPGSCSKVQAVGSKPAGNGKWGQADLVGNVWEWNVDVFANPYKQAACVNCAYTDVVSASQRVFRGGSAGNDGSFLLSASRYSRDPSDHNSMVGMRCARKP